MTTRVVMAPRLRSAIARQTAAAEARDSGALLVASSDVVSQGWSPMPVVFGGFLTDRIIGSLMLTGAAPGAARSARSAARRFGDTDKTPLSRIPETEWNPTELTLLRELRFLEGDDRPLPGMPGRRDIRILGSAQRRELRQTHAYLTSLAEHDATKATRAIAAIGRNDPAKFSVLAHALYRHARARGLAVKVPRKYDF